MRLKIFLAFCLVPTLSFLVNGQEKKDAVPMELIQTTKIDEFGVIQREELTSKLDKFTKLLQQNKDSQGFVFYYGSFNEPLFRQTLYYQRRKPNQFENYLTECCLNLPITTVIGGLREKPTIELWFVPAGGIIPKSSGEKDFQRELLYRFDLIESNYLEFGFAEKTNSDQTENILEIKNKIDLEDLLNVAGKVLQKDDAKRSVLIYYLNDKMGNVEAMKRAFENFVQENAENNELDLKRVKIVYGGYRRTSEVESWVIPINEVEPEVMPDEEFVNFGKVN